MKAKVSIVKDSLGYYATITLKQPLLSIIHDTLYTVNHTSKGQLKRKVIQFCGELNLDYEFI